MISVRQALDIHSIAIKNFGGSQGVRDNDALESALARPFQTYDGNDIYPSTEEKAAAIAESIIMKHPLIDGNKSTGYLLMEALLRYQNKKITADNSTLYDFVYCYRQNKV